MLHANALRKAEIEGKFEHLGLGSSYYTPGPDTPPEWMRVVAARLELAKQVKEARTEMRRLIAHSKIPADMLPEGTYSKTAAQVKAGDRSCNYQGLDDEVLELLKSVSDPEAVRLVLQREKEALIRDLPVCRLFGTGLGLVRAVLAPILWRNTSARVRALGQLGACRSTRSSCAFGSRPPRTPFTSRWSRSTCKVLWRSCAQP